MEFHPSTFNNDSGIFFAGTSFSTSGGPVNIGNRSLSDDGLLAALPYARGAEFNAYERQRDASCLPNTRVDVLADIMAWAGGRDDCGVYWLNGMAGTGKSTIARTIARRCAEQKQLGASFFFTRGGGDLASARKFVTTVARQLAAASAPLKRHIGRALRGGDNVASVALQDQWRRLVLEPLARGNGWHETVVSAFRTPRPLVLVVDALDECGSDDDVALLLALLSSAEAKLVRRRLRILVTSRPETQIRHCFDTVSEADCRRLILHRIEPLVVDNDIALFFDAKLTNISREFVCDPHWPGADNVRRLVERAGGLFIWAATACRFLFEGRQFADDRLEELLQGVASEKAPEQSLSHIYLTVLRAAARSEYRQGEEHELSQSLKDVLGTIAVLSAPLPGSSLARLLSLSDSGISRTLHSLHSILDIPDDSRQPIRLHHASFRDFLLDRERCSDARFWVHGATRHKILAEACLKVMCEALRQDMCGLRAPGTIITDINRGLVEDRLSPLVQYACCYWADHYRNAGHVMVKSNYIAPFLNKHFLHWLEALSLLGRLPDSVSIVTTLESLKLNMEPDIHVFVHDAKRFILANVSVIEQAPLQVYSAALLFAPRSSVVREQFAHAIPAWIRRHPKTQADWSANVLTLSCGSPVTTVALSPDSQLLACATKVASPSRHGIIWLWRTSTGELCGTLVGCEAEVTVLVFSPDSRLLVSGSEDGAVRLWNPIIRSLRGTLMCTACVSDAVFSPDGQLLAATLLDSAVRIWSVKNRALLHELRGEHAGWIRYVAFAPDGMSISVGSEDCPASVWDVTTGALLNTCKHDANNVASLALSPDGRLLACARKDRMVNVWKIADGTLYHSFPGHLAAATELTFSSDSSFLCSRGGSTSKIWDLQTGLLRCTVGNPNSAAHGPVLSPNGLLFVTGTGNKHLRVWDAHVGRLVRTLSGHTDMILKSVFSLDGQLIVSASDDGTLRLWQFNVNADGNGLASLISRRISLQREGTVLAVSRSNEVADVLDEKTDIWDSSTQAIQKTLDGKFVGGGSASGTAFLATSDTQVIRIHNAQTWELVFSYAKEPTSKSASAIAVSPDGQVLAVAFGDAVTVLYAMATGSLLRRLHKTGGAVAFSADSRLLATGKGNGVSLWDTQTAVESRTLVGPKMVIALAFSPSGLTLASADRDSVRLWNLVTGRTVRVLRLDDPAQSLAFSADGRRLVTDLGTLARPAEAAARSPLSALVGSSGGGAAAATAAADALTQMFITGGWVTWAGQRMLWLPPYFRKARITFTVYGTTLALCSPDGTIGFAAFDFSRAVEADAAKSSSASARAAAAPGLYRWGTPQRRAIPPTVVRTAIAWNSLVLLGLALSWSPSCSGSYMTFLALLLGINLLGSVIVVLKFEEWWIELQRFAAKSQADDLLAHAAKEIGQKDDALSFRT